MKSRFAPWALAGAILGACGEPAPPSTDGGVDSALADAGPEDAGPEDAGPDDAGVELDGGPIRPRTTARDEARDQMASVGAAVLAVPAGDRTGPEFLQLEMIVTRLDAIIGEKSTSLIEVAGIIGEKSMALSLTTVAVPTLVIAQQLDAALRELDAMIESSVWGASGDAMLAALETECIALRDRVVALRNLMWMRFRELVDTAVLTPRDVPDYLDQRTFHTAGGRIGLHFVIEGRSATDPTATLTVDCRDYPAILSVADAETGLELVVPTTPTAGPQELVLDLGHDTPRALRVEVSASDPMLWPACTASMSGRRRFRGDNEIIDVGEQLAIADENVSWSSNADGLALTLSATTALDPGRVAQVEQLARDASAAVSRLRTLQTEPSSIDADDYEIDQLVLERVILPLADTLLADPDIAADGAVTGHIRAWQTAIRQMLAQSAPGHGTPL